VHTETNQQPGGEIMAENASWRCMSCGELIVADDPWFHRKDCQKRKWMEDHGQMPPPRADSPTTEGEAPVVELPSAAPAPADVTAASKPPEAAPPADAPELAPDSAFPSDWRERNLRRRLPDEREAVTHHFVIHAQGVQYDGYLTVGFYPEGDVGEVFLKLHNQGSTVSGFCDCWSIAMSMLLQRGARLGDLCEKYRGMRFEPSGSTDTPGIRRALSPVDYAARYLHRRYVERLALADDPPVGA
jgi:hypothetical protein